MGDSNLFNTLRFRAFGSIVVLALSAYLASVLFSTDIHDFLIFSLVVSVASLVIILALSQRSQPRTEAWILFILAVLWLTMGAYSQDVIGYQRCYAMRGQTVPTSNNATMSAERYCRQMKSILAFSWAIFVLLTIWWIILLFVVDKLYASGDHDIWTGPMSDVMMPGEDPIPKPEPEAYPPRVPAVLSIVSRSYRARQSEMRSEELVRWTTMGISCAIGVQLLLFVLPSLRPYGTIIQVLLALGACGALAYVAVTDRRQNGNLTTDGHNRNELKMIGMFFILWLMFAIMFRMTGVGGGHSSVDAPAAVAPKSDTGRNHGREKYDPYKDTRRGSYRVYEEWLMSDYKVSLVNDNMQEFYVMFSGPEETAFAGGVWKIHVELPDQYPYKSPSIGFMNKIFHPNIDELSGSVCLDVINQTWSPMFDMINIFESFLPQLLRYPNPSDPLNGEAAALLMREPKNYEAKVREYVKRYASKEAAEAAAAEEDEEDEEDAEMSSVGSISDDEGNA
ncbi:unnamed protein product [Rhizoctonia solani]|uniref:UBC core domain-containing protein n=2 Tax=Rhizoctonia solani TaxID=456999 RepID=A0A8H3B1R0_9AGAM|nr:unnamed protein product [Rhizoctonia solani]